LLLVGCKKTQDEQATHTENEPAAENELAAENEPAVVQVVWRSMSDDIKETLHATLRSNREVEAVVRQRDRTAGTIKVMLTKERYTRVIEELRELDCCSLKSASQTQPANNDGQSQLEIHLDGMECLVTLWNSEWRVGRARECGLATTEFHGRNFLPDWRPTPSANDAQQ